MYLYCSTTIFSVRKCIAFSHAGYVYILNDDFWEDAHQALAKTASTDIWRSTLHITSDNTEF